MSSVDVGNSVEIGFVGFEGMESVVMGSVGTVERVEGPADSIQTVVGTEDDMQHFLDSILCDQEFPAATDCNRKRQPTALATAAATAQASAVAMALHTVHSNSLVGFWW